MNNHDRQEREELTVFSEFAQVCLLPLLANTAQKLPEGKGNVDILCDLESGDKLAFELVTCEDVRIDGKPTQKPTDDACYCYVRVCIVKRIEDKLSQKYESDHKIHLLAWSNMASAEELKHRDKDLPALLKSNGMGKFDRIWVFGRCGKSIVFDSEERT